MEQTIPIIRQATIADAALLANLGARTFADTFAPHNTAENMDAYLKSVFGPEQQAAELQDPRSTFLIAELEGVAAGYAKLHAGDALTGVTGPRPLELVRLYVLANWHGRGVGAALMRACLEETQRTGYETLWLGVWEHNPRARAFYRKWDFREVGAHRFQLGADTQTDLLLQRSVGASPDG